MGITIPLVIDRTRLAGHGISFNQYLQARNLFPTLKGLKLTEGTITYHPSEYTSRLHYALGKSEAIAAIEVWALPNKQCALIYEIWPHRTGTRFREFHDAITSTLQDEEFTYQSVFAHGHVQYIEYALDNLTRPMHSFIPWTPRAKYSTIYPRDIAHEDLGQIKIGAKRSPIRFSVYDYALKMQELGLYNQFPTRTRIEAIVFEPLLPGSLVQRMRPSQVDKQLNPFRHLEIAELSTARNLSPDIDWQQFLDIATAAEAGAPEAFKELTKEERLKARKMLRLSKALWWNPDQAWAGHLQANAKIHPQHLLQ